MLVLITLIAAFLSTFAFARPGLPEQAQAVYDAWAPLDAEAKSVEEQLHTLGLAYEELQEMTVQSEEHLEGARQSLAHLIDYAAQEKAGDEQQRQLVEQMLQASRQHTEETQDALDMILSKMLGDPVGQTFAENGARSKCSPCRKPVTAVIWLKSNCMIRAQFGSSCPETGSETEGKRRARQRAGRMRCSL